MIHAISNILHSFLRFRDFAQNIVKHKPKLVKFLGQNQKITDFH